MTDITISVLGSHHTVVYASRELQRCLGAMTGGKAVVRQLDRQETGPPGIRVGLASDLPGAVVPPVADPVLDDAWAYDVRGSEGWIAGANPRSVLLGAYRYLHALGCRWVRPGADGELIPRGITDLSATGSEAPAYRHRGICIEGAVGEHHVRDMVEWCPRVGLNAYFTQFRESYTFFDRWYSHQGNPLRGPEPFDIERSREILRGIVSEIRLRDLVYHAVGHGWTCEPFGMPGLGWDLDPVEATPEVEPYLALVNGKRQVWEGVPLNTNLCYSNPEVRRIMAEDITGYAREHPDVDALHVWLADGTNNNCECTACAEARPSDFYVMLLNELDAALTRERLPTRIVFLMYVDLLWPPEHRRIENPDRFILMFAPITRSYSRSFAPSSAMAGELPPFERNKLQFPRSVDENVAFLRAWSVAFVGDSFDFDYHFMWDHYNDPGYCRVAGVLHDDIRNLANLGLNGLMSCQTQRAFFPTGLGMYAMADALRQPDGAFGESEEEYFCAAFGPDWQLARGHLYTLSDLFDPVYLRGEKPEADAPAGNVNCAGRLGFDEVPDVIEGFRPVIERNTGLTEPAWSASWRYLGHHADLCVPLAGAYAARARGDHAEAGRLWSEVVRMAWELEPALHGVLDVYLFVQTLSGRFAAR